MEFSVKNFEFDKKSSGNLGAHKNLVKIFYILIKKKIRWMQNGREEIQQFKYNQPENIFIIQFRIQEGHLQSSVISQFLGSHIFRFVTCEYNFHALLDAVNLNKLHSP